jgi:high frequency lysogenization protein
MLSGHSIDPYRSSLRYALAVLHLQRQLAGDEALLATIGRRLRHSALQANHFADNSDDIAASCAAVYQDTISTYRYRIKINGSVQALQSPLSVNRIRALLLAGIRSATLWRQLGGRRWHIALSRKKMLTAIKNLAAAAPSQH